MYVYFYYRIILDIDVDIYIMIIAISIILTLIILFYVNSFYSRKKLNPIDSLSFEGCMGIRLGDKRDFVISRINHLKLLSSEEKTDYERLKLADIHNFISTSRELFNNVGSVVFGFGTDGALETIIINLNNEINTYDDLCEIIRNRLDRILKTPHTEDEPNGFSWKSNKSELGLIYDGDLYIGLIKT